jgi:hypothetical protein
VLGGAITKVEAVLESSEDRKGTRVFRWAAIKCSASCGAINLGLLYSANDMF